MDCRRLLMVVAASVVMLLSANPVFGEIVREIYISSTTGDDANPGTKSRPKRSVNSLSYDERGNSRILLKRGDVFFGYFLRLRDCEIGAYGRGDMPVVCGFRVLKNVDAWEAVGDGLWRLDMSRDDDFTGIPSRLASDGRLFNDIGCIYNPATDSIYGHIVKDMESMKKDGDLYTSESFDFSNPKAAEFRYVYLRLKDNPRVLGNLCFSTYQHGISEVKNSVIKDICFIGFARHGACGMTGCRIGNCRFDVIGGSVQVGYKNWVRYGNGVEFWSNCYDNIVERCTITRTYDCATTIQGTGSIPADPRNIHFRDNRIAYCRQAFEYFLNDPTRDAQFVDCSFTGNLCYMMGQNGFSTPQPRDADILCYSRKPTPIDISRNIFYGAPYFCSRSTNSLMRDNDVYIYSGQYLNYFWIKDYRPLNAGNIDALRQFRADFGDNSRITVVERGSTEDRAMSRKLLKKLALKPVNLRLGQLLER